MKFIRETLLLDKGNITATDEWRTIQQEIREAIAAISWPPGSTGFTINPIRKKNGVKPIKDACMLLLNSKFSWTLEAPIFPRGLRDSEQRSPGKVDAARSTGFGTFVVEWETGNISSSHRALNKMALAIMQKAIVGGVLILPTRRLYTYLTDRIGNYEELQPYFPLWQSLNVDTGLLAVIAIEHDAEDPHVPRIAQGTDGRALR